jgi:hypothetical protein
MSCRGLVAPVGMLPVGILSPAGTKKGSPAASPSRLEETSPQPSPARLSSTLRLRPEGSSPKSSQTGRGRSRKSGPVHSHDGRFRRFLIVRRRVREVRGVRRGRKPPPARRLRSAGWCACARCASLVTPYVSESNPTPKIRSGHEPTRQEAAQEPGAIIARPADARRRR